MHISSYRKITLAEIDATILDRISGAEVEMWLAARLMKIRGEGVVAHDLEAEADYRAYGSEHYLDTNWTIHGPGRALAMTHRTVEDAVAHLRSQLHNDPAGQAAEKRAEAKRLLAEAEELSTVAASLG